MPRHPIYSWPTTGAPTGGRFAPVSEDAARATLETAWACGVRAFDTVPHYGAGRSEQRLAAGCSTAGCWPAR